MLDPRTLYRLDPSLWEATRTETEARGAGPVLIHLMEGFIDAGQVGQTLSKYLLDHLEHEPLVTFDHDQLHDYRARRPAMTFDNNRWVAVKPVAMTLHRVRDASGTPFLLLTGPEPDVQWERASAAITGLVETLRVALTVTAYGIPMGVPHTRPTMLTEHATDPSLVGDNPVWVGRLEVPGSFAAMIELALGEREHRAVGFAANVPHYLSNAPFHQAALTALERIVESTGLELPTEPLRADAEANLAELTAEVEASEEVREVVTGLEVQYDAAQASESRLPSAEEIGAELERFLAERDKREDK